MSEPMKIGVAGLGTVGASLVQLLEQNASVIEKRAGRPVLVTHVNARSKGKDRGIDLSQYQWMDDAIDLANADVDMVVELIGGADGAAYDLAKLALQNGKHVVTANKAMLAHHGAELAQLAEDNDCILACEAAVAGGIPILKTLREGFAGNDITSVYGILNGTCNYMMSEMRVTGAGFDDILRQAQDKGYAEADPSFDIDGIDAGHKLSLISAMIFGQKPDFDSLDIQGIRGISAQDIAFASQLDLKIKLLGLARRHVDGSVSQSVEPCLVSSNGPIGMVEGVDNAVLVEGDYVGKSLSVGPGAGGNATASAVAGDIIDIARGAAVNCFGIPASELKDAVWRDMDDLERRFYLRVNVEDKAGVIAELSAVLSKNGISIEDMIQRGAGRLNPVPVMFTTHRVSLGQIKKAVSEIEEHKHVVEKPCLMRIEEI